jgi:hypothetical protein
VRAFSTGSDSASVTSIVSKWRHLQSRKQRKRRRLSQESRVNGRRQPFCFFKTFRVGNESVKWCAILMQQPDLLSLNFWPKSAYNFKHSPQNVVVLCGVDCLACRNGSFVLNPLDVKGSDEHVLDFVFHMPSFSGLNELNIFIPSLMYGLCLSSGNGCIIIVTISRSHFPEITLKFIAHLLSVPSRNRNRKDTRLQRKGRKNTTLLPHCSKFCIPTPSTW